MHLFLRIFIILLMILALLIAFLPTIMSTDWGRKQTVSWINRAIPGNVEIQFLDLHWGKGQVIGGFLLKDPEGQAILEIDRFSTEATLWQLMKKSPCLGFTQIQNLNAAIVTDEKGQTNLHRALDIHLSEETAPLSPSIIVLSDVNIESYLFSPNHPLSIQIKGLTRQNHLNGSFELNLFLKGSWASNWKELKHEAQNYLKIEGDKEAKIRARVVNFPVDLMDRLAAVQNPHLNGLFHSLLGDRLNLNLDKETSQEGLAFNLTLLSPLLQGDIKGKIKKDLLSLNEPAVFHLNLTPEFINPLTEDRLELMETSRLEIVVSDLIIPLNIFHTETIIDPCLFGFKSELKLPETGVDIDSIGKLKILSLQTHLTSLPCHKSIQVEVVGQVQQHNQPPFNVHLTSSLNKPSNFFQLNSILKQFHLSKDGYLDIALDNKNFHVEGSLTHLFDQENRLRNWQEMDVKAKLNGTQLSPTFLQSLLPLNADQKQKLRALFGDTFDVNAACHLQNLNGPIQMFVKGSQGHIQLEGQIKQGVFILSQPLEGSVEMTPLFVQTFLTPHVPFLSTVIGAENPLTFTIEPSQFSCPLFPFQLEQIKISKGNLNLGKVHFRNEGELSSILNLIHFVSDQDLTIWFTPIYVTLSQGVLSLKRFDMLVAHAYTLANWGSIHLLTHQAHFVLGLGAQTLQYAFGIQGLDENYILPIPLDSAKGKVEIDKKKVTARISSLVAQTHGGTKGKLLGSILEMALSDKGEPYPPPTTQPFPWKNEFNSNPQQNASLNQGQADKERSKEKKKKKKKRQFLDSDNIQDLQEGAFQLLDQWLSH